MHAARIFAALAVLVVSGGAAAAPAPSFHLVFDGRHTPELLHQGTFTTSSPLCPSGSATDVSVEATTDTAMRRFTCAAGGDFTAKVRPLPAEHGGNGTWQIVGGSGPLAMLRGKGTFVSTRLAGRLDDPATITFRSTWEGVADFDVTAPAIGVMTSSAKKLRHLTRTYSVRLVLSLTDASEPVSYVLQLVESKRPSNALAFKVGRTITGTLTTTVRIKTSKGARTVQIKIDASDAVGNEAAFTKTMRLR